MITEWLKRGCDNIFVVDGEIIARISKRLHWEDDEWFQWNERQFLTLAAAKKAVEAWHKLPHVQRCG